MSRKFFRRVCRLLQGYYLGETIAHIYEEEIRQISFGTKREKILQFLQNIIPQHYRVHGKNGYIAVALELMYISCLNYLPGKNNLIYSSEPIFFPSERNERIMVIYKKILKLFTKKDLQDEISRILIFYLPDPLNVLRDRLILGRAMDDIYRRSRFFIGHLLRTFSVLKDEETGLIWDIIAKDHRVEKALLLYMILLFIMAKGQSWWVFTGNDLISFARRFSVKSRGWKYQYCQMFIADINESDGIFVIDCLIEKRNITTGKQKWMIPYYIHIHDVFTETWMELSTNQLNLYFCPDVVSIINDLIKL